MTEGLLIILSGPSGSGKSTLLQCVMKSIPNLVFSVSHTTRKARPGEENGVQYHFVDKDAFLLLRDQEPSGFLEWAEVHGELYGTSVDEIERKLQQGVDVLLDIDVQGARQVRLRREAVSVFLAPPSLKVLTQRLQNRATEDEAKVTRRLENAKKELTCSPEYTYLLVNDKLEEAVEGFRSIVIAERLKQRRMGSGEKAALSW